MPQESEHAIQTLILQYLDIAHIFHYRQNSGMMKKGKSYVKFGAKGAPDIVCVINGKYLGLEVKDSRGKTSKDQLIFCDKLSAAGGSYALVRSVEEAKTVINLLK